MMVPRPNWRAPCQVKWTVLLFSDILQEVSFNLESWALGKVGRILRARSLGRDHRQRWQRYDARTSICR